MKIFFLMFHVKGKYKSAIICKYLIFKKGFIDWFIDWFIDCDWR